jgi:outer membrane protein OmpA-like peptidoglycan-associated protein
MKHYLQSLLVTFVVCTTLNGQSDIKIHKKDFKNNKTGFETAWEQVTKGDAYYAEKGIWYRDAFNEYQKAQAYNDINAGLNYKTGVAALYSDNKEKATKYLLKSLEEDSTVTEDILLMTGRALQYSGNYYDAIDKLDSYLNAPGKKPHKNIVEAKKWLDECNAALILTEDTLRIEIKNMGSNINSGADDYSEVLSADGKTMFFASRREIAKNSTSYSDSKFDENILFSSQSGGDWAMASVAGKNLTTKYCEAPLFLDSEGEHLYIYEGYENGGDIKVSVKKKGIWKNPENVPFKINSSGSETSFTFTPDEKEAWFVSDHGKQGLGGKDIYFIRKMSEHKWSKPVNAGPMINTPSDEESVRFSTTGDTLWFSSRGHSSIGGFDIFYSVKDQTGQWGEAQNYGYPLNTPWDELFYCPAPDKDSSFYFVSNRIGTSGGLDIYCGRILPPEPVVIPVEPPKPDTVVIRDTVVVIKEIVQAPPPPSIVEPEPVKEVVLYLIGKVTDSETGDPVLAKIDVIDITSNQVVATTASSDVDGTYRIKLPDKKPYLIDLRATGFLSDMKRINIPVNFNSDFYSLDATLTKVKVGEKVVLNNILFETGKSTLTAGSYTELGRLLVFMQDNPRVRLEISGHTDKTGSEPVNFKLSGSRAKAVVDFLISKGIESSRLEYRGFGSLQPVADNATAAGRAQNRRVEFKILEF